MPELSIQELQEVEQKLQEAGLSYDVLEAEMLDHICCSIEQDLASGTRFSEAMQSAFDAFGEDELKKLETETISIINQNSITMKKMLISLAAGMFLVVTTLLSFNVDPPSRSPLKGDTQIASSFGMRMHPILKEKRMHKGCDFKAPLGTEIFATSDGVVEKVNYSPEGYGYHVVIRHDTHYKSLYGQMTADVRVEKGQVVKAGELIGFVGSSGKSTGPHLHYEVIKDGEHVDPEPYLGL